MSPEEARFAAQRAFGGVEQAKEHQRDARAFRWIDDSLIDFKLGARMLKKYPGLSIVGGIGLAAAIAIGSTSFAFFYSYLYSTLPLDEGHRVVALENWDVGRNNEEQRSLHDFVGWRKELRTLDELSAFHTIGRNLIVPGGTIEPVQIAEITASAFTLTRVPPMLGRFIVEGDEQPGAAQVVVIGHDVWQSRFASDPAIVGRDIRLGNNIHTIVGVMPAGFKFPVNHSYWVPLQINLASVRARPGSGGVRLRPAGARRRDERRAGGGHHRRRPSRRAISRHPRHARAARDAICTPDPGHPGRHRPGGSRRCRPP